ncbi:MAG: UDP-N-acetylmuramyl-tripeptide synthetase [Candidatus Taylorbacteria bacterium]|nr:UDP-N-acetylmuramyl-tripeptide synthetase [Candidatus Taylorbacteria bacterium]
MDKALFLAKKLIPKPFFNLFQPVYHYFLALVGAVLYRFPSRRIKVIAVTGTKGKSSVVEMLTAIFDEAGLKTASASTIRFKVGEKIERNLFKMTTPGRFFIQRFLRQAVDAKCDVAVIEMTSEAARQFRHKFIDFDALIFNNLQKEHIESHGSFEKYRDAKLEIARALAQSRKSPKFMVANADDKESEKFFAAAGNAVKISFSLKNAEPYKTTDNGVEFNFAGKAVSSKLVGLFNIYNLIASASCAQSFGVSEDKIREAIEKISSIPGRAEIVRGKNFDVVVDYAHTPDSLRAIYEAFPGRMKICVLGNTGGGRDTWKRPEMGRIADQYCTQVILTNEDPYDEDPRTIVDEMAATIQPAKLTIEMNRAKAIGIAVNEASKNTGSVVLLTGKGTDPFIMEAGGKKTPWSDKAEAEKAILLNVQ